MGARSLGGLIDIGMDVLSTTVSAKTRKILVQVGNVLKKTVESNAVEWIQHVGIVSLPSTAVPGKNAAQCIVLKTGDHDVVIGSSDLRGLELAGELKSGETCVYAAGEDGEGQARALFKANGGIHLYTRKGNRPDGVGMTFQIDAQAGALRMLNDKGFAIVIDEAGVKMTAGKASLTLSSSGDVTLVGTGKTQVDGSSVVIGSVVAPGANAALVGPTGVAGRASLKVAIE